MTEVQGASGQKPAIPWLGIAAILATVIVLIFLINRTLPAQDGCTSDLMSQGKGLEFDFDTKLMKGGAKVSPVAQQALSERLQVYAQTTTLLCRMNAKGALSDTDYSVRINQISNQMSLLMDAVSKGKLARASEADIAQLIYDGLSQQAIGPFILFFNWQAAEITEEAGVIVKKAAQQCREATARGANLIVDVTGIGASSESGNDPSANSGIATNRLISVIRELKNQGCDIPAAIRINTPSELTPDDGMRELRNRRVEIIFSPAVI